MTIKNQTKATTSTEAAENQTPLTLLASSVTVDPIAEIVAAEGETAKPKPRRFNIVAYTGAEMRVSGWRYPVVIDYEGLDVTKQKRPILIDHERTIDAVMGQTDQVAVVAGELLVAGEVMGESQRARDVLALNDKGFSWQASVTAKVLAAEFVPEGKSAQANGRTFAGPLSIARRSTLDEVSFVILGADGNTSAHIAATQGNQEHMPPETEPQTLPTVSAASPQSLTSTFADFKSAKERRDKILAISAKALEMPGVTPEFIEAAVSDAEKGNWSADQFELHILRATRPTHVAIVDKGKRAGVTNEVLSAACCLAHGLQNIEKHFSEPAIEAAEKRFSNGFGLNQMLIESARANGYNGSSFRADNREVLEYAFGHHTISAAAPSNISVAGILGTVSNKFLKEGFYAVEQTWRRVCSTRPVNDFKTITSYRLIGEEQYQTVAPGGELKHGTLGEQSYTNKADTYGLKLDIDRRDIRNDDLGALTTIPRRLGRGAGLKINDIFWTKLLANTGTFFGSGNSNYIEGAGTVLGIDSLTQAETAFMNYVDAQGKPIGIMPSILLVPPALATMGNLLLKSLEIRDTTASTKYPTANPHNGKYSVEVSRYLSNASYTGYSTTAWYLLANPSDLAVIEVVFLDGKEVPTIETAEADFSQLGIQMRGYHDFGVELQDKQAGLKSKGAA